MSFTKELLQRCKDEGDRAKILTIFQNSLEARSYKVREAAALVQRVGMSLEASCVCLPQAKPETREKVLKVLAPLGKTLAIVPLQPQN